jgi:hypothetical protein
MNCTTLLPESLASYNPCNDSSEGTPITFSSCDLATARLSLVEMSGRGISKQTFRLNKGKNIGLAEPVFTSAWL